MKKLTLAVLLSALLAVPAFAKGAAGFKTRVTSESTGADGILSVTSSNAFDTSSNYANTAAWTTGSNGGTGFGAWTLTDGDGGHYIGSTGLGSSTFGLFNTFSTTTTDAVRPLTGGFLSPGQTFSIDLGFTTFAASGAVGLNFHSGTTESLTLFTDGANWMLNDGGSPFGIGTATANTPYHFTLTYNGGNSYSFTLTGALPGNNFTATNNLTGIDNIRYFDFNQGGGANFGFDNMAVVPEPSTLALLAGPMLLGGWFFVRRRRA